MNWDHALYFILGFAAATVLIVFVGFFWLKRRWKTLLFGLGSKLFSKGMQHISNRAQAKNDESYREIGRQ